MTISLLVLVSAILVPPRACQLLTSRRGVADKWTRPLDNTPVPEDYRDLPSVL